MPTSICPNLDARVRAALPHLTTLDRFRLADQLAGKDEPYVEAYLAAARGDGGTASGAGTADSPKGTPRVDSAAARQKMIKDLERACQKPAAK